MENIIDRIDDILDYLHEEVIYHTNDYCNGGDHMADIYLTDYTAMLRAKWLLLDNGYRPSADQFFRILHRVERLLEYSEFMLDPEDPADHEDPWRKYAETLDEALAILAEINLEGGEH